MTATTKKKHVIQEMFEHFQEPDDAQDIVKVIRGCGNNLHEVVTAKGDQYLVSMPSKFRRSIWIKRGDYLIVNSIEEGNKVKAEIHSILLKDHIRHLKNQNKWPKEFDDDNDIKNEEVIDLLSPNINHNSNVTIQYENNCDDSQDDQTNCDNDDEL
ncbi:UDP-glycosyltransferase [Sarcoptes scabiei]|nr:UDP-glycosyltransferase [Sarcoptes scabiei]